MGAFHRVSPFDAHRAYQAEQRKRNDLISGLLPPTHPQLVFVIGATNAGKSLFMDAAKEHDNLGTVEVGRMMREKYPPEHFQGNAAPEHTVAEAWAMMREGIDAHLDKRYIFIDGQPRDKKQAEDITRLWPAAWFMLLAASHETREARAMQRDGDDPARMALTRARLDTDYRGLFDVLQVLITNKARLRVFDTEAPGFSIPGLVKLFASHFFKPSYPDLPERLP